MGSSGPSQMPKLSRYGRLRGLQEIQEPLYEQEVRNSRVWAVELSHVEKSSPELEVWF